MGEHTLTESRKMLSLVEKIKGGTNMQFGVWIAIFISALLSYGIALFYEQPIHWYVLILLIVTGLFINTVILILRMQDQDEHNS